MKQVNQVKSKKMPRVRKNDPEWIKVIARALLDRSISNLSENQIKILRNLYLEYLRDGMSPKEAMDKAFQIVTCFKT